MISAADLTPFGQVSCSEPLARHTTYHIGGPADYFVEVYDEPCLQSLIRLLDREQTDWMVLGMGSNVLIDDVPYHGVVISLTRFFNRFFFEKDCLICQAGCSMIRMAVEAMHHSLSGLEFAYGIPGSMGGGVYMNAGAYRSDLSDLIEEVTVLRNGRVETLPAAELDFTYRHSIFQTHKDWVILSARLRLHPGDPAAIQALMDSRKQRRLSSQPVSRPSAGSVFRNPEGMNAWQVVDDLGFRGRRCGGAQVSEMHSNFIINEDHASARDVDRLIRLIQKEALAQYGVTLITEVERINWHADDDEQLCGDI